MNRTIQILLLGTAMGLAGCATLSDPSGSEMKITDTSSDHFRNIAAESATSNAAYTYGQQQENAEWIVCKVKDAKATILLMHTDKAGFEKSRFCNGWLAQAFLSQGLNTITVNRPGYGASTGTPEFAGPQTIEATAAGLKDAVLKSKIPAPTGIWGYSSGATAALLVSRKVSGLQYAIVGGGIYDLDDTLKKTTDSYIKTDIETIKKTGGDKAIEDRSVAYDVSGLPKSILIYHGKQDSVVPPAQAQAFADSLASSGEYKASIQMIDGLSHEIPWSHHRKILEIMAASVHAGTSAKK